MERPPGSFPVEALPSEKLAPVIPIAEEVVPDPAEVERVLTMDVNGPLIDGWQLGPNAGGLDCGCQACPDCRPAVAAAAERAGASFVQVLGLVQKSEAATLTRITQLPGAPRLTRQQRRATERRLAKKAKRQ